MPIDKQIPILVAGATGYIGARLIPRLLQAGYRVRALARTPAKLRDRPWARDPGIEIVQGDLLDKDSMIRACQGCQAAYYLVHSMNPTSRDFARTDREAAGNMVAAAETAGIKRIIYLSGLGEEDETLSEHLRSRAEVARLLRTGKVPVTVLRAAMIIGSGSASFEILRYLVERLPVMITPRWVDTPCQPIAIQNVLHYLIGCLDCDETTGRVFDIGQPEVVSYRQLMRLFSEEAGLAKRLIIPVPVLTPRLSSYWIHLVTPVPAVLARPLAEGLRNTVVCQDFSIRELIPQPLLDCRQAVRVALEQIRNHQVESSWSDAGRIPPAAWSTPGDPSWAGGTHFDDTRQLRLEGSAEEAWKAVARIGGTTGWYHANWLWWVRGLLDQLVGGIGLRRGRRCPIDLAPGDAVDFWRVASVDKPRRLLLVAEMKVPGEALLEFRIDEDNGEAVITQTARFLPKGLSGILYWYAIAPFHNYVFTGMLKGIAESTGGRITRGPKRINDPGR